MSFLILTDIFIHFYFPHFLFSPATSLLLLNGFCSLLLAPSAYGPAAFTYRYVQEFFRIFIILFHLIFFRFRKILKYIWEKENLTYTFSLFFLITRCCYFPPPFRHGNAVTVAPYALLLIA